MLKIHYTKSAKILRALLVLSLGGAVIAQAESNIDKYRSKNKPLFRRYAEKLKLGKNESSSLKAEKRSLPPGTFKQKGLFGKGIESELPGNRNSPIMETPFIPEETEPNKPWIDSGRFKPLEDTRSRFEGAEPQETTDPETTILDFDNLAQEIVNQSIGDSSILTDGIVPSEEELDRLQPREGADELFPGARPEEGAAGYNPFDELNRQTETDGVTPFQPALSPILAEQRNSPAPRGNNNQDGNNTREAPNSEAELMRSNQQSDQPFESAVADQRLVIGAPEEEPESDDLNAPFSQANDIINNVVSPHMEAYQANQEKRTRSGAEKLLSKYAFKPANLQYSPDRKARFGEEDDLPGRSRQGVDLFGQQKNAALTQSSSGQGANNLRSNPAAGFPNLQNNTEYRPTSNVDPLASSGFPSSPLETSPLARPTSMDALNRPRKPASGFSPVGQSTRIGGSLPSRFESGFRPPPRGTGVDNFGATNTGNNRSPIDLMKQSRDRNRVQSALGNQSGTSPFGR